MRLKQLIVEELGAYTCYTKYIYMLWGTGHPGRPQRVCPHLYVSHSFECQVASCMVELRTGVAREPKVRPCHGCRVSCTAVAINCEQFMPPA